MNEHVILFCNLEHLPPHDVPAGGGSPGKWAFGLNLSVAINDEIPGQTLDTLKPFMQPWTWPQLLQVKVRVKDGGSGRTTTETILPLKWKGEVIDCGHCATEKTDLKPDLDIEYGESKGVGADAFKWQPTVEPGKTNLGKTSKIRNRPWHTFVGQLSTNPAPVPQCLNLSFIFFVDKIDTPGPKIVFAAPMVPKTSPCAGLASPFNAALVPKDDAPVEWAGHTGIFQWEYVTDAGAPAVPKLIAYMAESAVMLTAPPVATFLDLNTQWVGNLFSLGESDVFADDWRAMLEDRMADGLDLGQRIIEYLRTKINDPTILPQLKLYQWAAIASFRDMAGAGIHRGPDNKRFIDFVFQQTDPGSIEISELHENQIEQNIIKEFGTLAKWLKFIADNFPEVAKLSVMAPPRLDQAGTGVEPVVPEEQATVAQIVAELEQLHAVIFDPNNLAILLRAQWRVAGKGVLTDMSLVEKADLNAFNVRHNLARENLGDLWQAILKMPSTRSGQDLIRQNFSCLFQQYFCQRFNLSLAGLTAEVGAGTVVCDTSAMPTGRKRQPEFAAETTGTVSIPFPFNSIRDPITTYIRQWSKEFVEVLLPTKTNEPTIVPHPITMQVDGLARRPDETANSEDRDTLKRIAGIGVLMRKQGGPWRCLNLAAAYNKQNTKLIADPVLAPSRLNYRNGLRQAFLTYNNQPLTARSPLTDDEMTIIKVRDPRENTPGFPNNPPLLFLNYSQIGEARRLPGLEFGKTFEILPFVVANCGALPAALLADNAALRSPIEAAVTSFDVAKLSPADQNKIRKVDYRRKVRVGGIRVLDGAGRVSLEMPSIPETVFPRARDIHQTAMEPANAIGKRDPAENPLLLLAPRGWSDNPAARSSFEFTLRKPATDINTWDRWIAGSMARDKRVSVWADFYRKSESKRQSDLAKDKGLARFQVSDTSIDDPAASNDFFFELWTIDGSSMSPALSRWVPIGLPAPAATGMESVQSQLMHVKCETGGAADAITVGEITIDDPYHPGGKIKITDVQITLREGQVYQVNVSTSINKAEYSTRFDDVINLKKEVTNSAGKAVYLTSPFSMLIETATNTLVEGVSPNSPNHLDQAGHKLWTLLRPDFGLAEHPGAITVGLAPAGAPAVEGFQYLHRAELLRQVWRWQGRETPLHPRLNSKVACANLEDCAEMDAWEAWEFGNRFDTDHLIQDMTTLAPTRLGGRKFFYKEVLETGAATDELRALHYRFGARAFSRYAGIMPPGIAASVETKGQIPKPGETRETRWRRLFVPCRRRKELPIPKVKLILPLTESFGGETGNTAGLLVVLNEPWYEEAGLGEGIAAEVVKTPGPENNPTGLLATDKFYFELGTDPIVQLAQQGYEQSKNRKDEVCLNQKIRGPVGHTFDRTNEDPLFTATSFIIPAPAIFSTIPGQAKTKVVPDLAWNFCRLRLRRVVVLKKDEPNGADCNLTAGNTEVLTCDPPAGDAQLAGPFTDPYWVQYLPQFTQFSTEDNKLVDARLKFEKGSGGQIQLSIVNPSGQRIPLSAQPSTNQIFELYLVLTRRVFDATGRPDQEIYLEVFHSVANNFWETSGRPSIPNDETLRGRIIEVQRRPPNTPPLQFLSGDELWRALFGHEKGKAEPTDSELARIVRISPPINSLTSTDPGKC